MIRKPNFKLNWKYALGELVLIFLGISLAIAFQNWNASMEEDSLEASYYCILLDDVRQDSLKVAQQKELTQSRIKSANQLLAQLQKGDASLEELSGLIVNSVAKNTSDVSVTSSAFDDIKSSGNLHLIRDEKIKQALLTYHDDLRASLNVINSNQERVTTDRFFNPNDLINSGWIYFVENQNGFDHEVVDVASLKKLVNMTDEDRNRLINDAIFYIAINSRNLQHYAGVDVLIEDMLEMLNEKCEDQ